MKFRILLLAAISVGNAYAQNPTLTYRSSDPFLFCTEGQNPKTKGDRCWWPIPPYTGGSAWVNAPWCEPEDPEGKPWDADDYASLAQYQDVCRYGKQAGAWDSKGGERDMVPTQH